MITDAELGSKCGSVSGNDISASLYLKSGSQPNRQDSSLIKAVHASREADAMDNSQDSQAHIELAQLKHDDQRGASDLEASK